MKKNNSLLKKVLILFISVSIPFTALSTYMLRRSNQELVHQVLASIDSNNLNFISQFNSTLDTIYINSFNLINQSNYLKFANTNPDDFSYEKGTQIKLMREQFSGLCRLSSFIESTHVYFEPQKVVFNSSGYLYGSYLDISTKKQTLLSEIQQTGNILHYYRDDLTQEPTLALFLFSLKSSDYCSSIVLSQHELQKYLDSNTIYEGERYLLTSDSSFSLTNFNSETKNKAFSFHEQLTQDTLGDTCWNTTINGEKYYVFCYDIPILSAQYLRFIPTRAILKNTNISPLLTIFFYFFVFSACILFFIGIHRLVHRPLIQLTSAFEKLETGDFQTKIEDNQNADFSYLFNAFNNMTLKLNELIERDYHQKLLFQKAELKQLQAQINPHFLYNSFFMLQRMIKLEMMDEAQEMSNALGIYFRYLTRNSMDFVTLSEEYEHAKTYAYIQGLRFDKRILIRFDELPPECAKIPTPKLILQPLLENAFNYGLNNKVSNGLLEIHFSLMNNTLTIIVEENGEELTEEALKALAAKLNTAKESSTDFEMTGLYNIQRRLALFSDSANSLQVSRSRLGGLCVSITLQLNPTEES